MVRENGGIEAMLRQVGVDVETDHVAITGAGRHRLRRIHRKAAAQEQVMRIVPVDGFRHGAEIGVRVLPQPRAIVVGDGRMRRIRQRRGKAGGVECAP